MYFFFCKQKTAYEMRSSDWSSDVCSSDLAVVASSTDAIISKSLNGIVQSWNAGAEQIFGYKAEEMIGQPIIRITPAELRQEEEEILSKLRRGERIEHFETIRLGKNGERKRGRESCRERVCQNV